MSKQIFNALYGYKRSTPNKHVYDPITNVSTAPLRDLYFQKWIFGEGEPPATLSVTVEVVEEGDEGQPAVE